MITRIFLHLAVFGYLIVAICYGTKLNSNEAEARTFLKQSSDKLFSSFDEIVNKAFNDDFDNYDYDEHEANKNYSIFYKQIFEDSRKFDIKNFKDEELKYAFKMLDRDADEYILGKERYSKLFLSLQELKDLQKDNLIKKYGNSNNKLAYSPDIKKIIKTTNDSAELQYYWSAWRQITGKWAKDNLNITIEVLRDAAQLFELTPLEFWSRETNITDMEKLMADIKPLYLELHAFIRDLLRKKFGESIIAPDGLIPEHLLEQVLQQSVLEKGTILEEMFPFEKLPPVGVAKFDGKQLYQIADKFYENLGFKKYPSSIWDDRIKMISSEDDFGECQSNVYYGTPSIHLEFCEKLNFQDYLDAYKNMGYLYYAKEMEGLPAYYFKSPFGLDFAIVVTAYLSASTHHSLKAVGMIKPDFNTTHEIEMNRLLRIAIDSLFYVPINLANAKVMGDLVSGNIKISELSNHYWHLMAKYAGVGPPKDYKSHTLIDLPYYFFDEMNDNDMSSDFISEFLIYEIYKKLCELSGKYPKEPLHLCDFSGSKEVGNALKKMMRLGSSKPLNGVLASILPENPTVTAEGLLEYYNPIKKLLIKMNKEANVKPGWKSSDSIKSKFRF